MVQQTIAIAGAERGSGSVIAQKLAALNQYPLLILSENEDHLKDLPDILQQRPGSGLEQINCLKDGCWEADIIILDVPFASSRKVAEKIKEVSTQKIVFILPDMEKENITKAGADNEWKNLLPNARLVIASGHLDSSGTILTGTDEESLNTIAEIIKKLGFMPIIKNKN